MPKKKPSKGQKARSTDADMVGIIRSRVDDPRHIAYSSGSPHDVRHLMPGTRKQMGFEPYPTNHS